MMNDDKFDLKIIDLHWLENLDESYDLCAHGHIYLKIGDQIVSDEEAGDWTLSSTALSLLRSIESDYEKDDYSNQLFPCCGHSFIPDDKGETVIIQGCDIGIDWKIIHTKDNKVRHILNSGQEITIDNSIYKKKVIAFVDQVEQFFKTSKPKIIPKDDFDKKGYVTFWKEWRNLRDKWK
jgi:hypothetical protein